MPYVLQRIRLNLLDRPIDIEGEYIPFVHLRRLQTLKLRMHQIATREMSLACRGAPREYLLRCVEVYEADAQVPRQLGALAQDVTVMSLQC